MAALGSAAGAGEASEAKLRASYTAFNRQTVKFLEDLRDVAKEIASADHPTLVQMHSMLSKLIDLDEGSSTPAEKSWVHFGPAKQQLLVRQKDAKFFATDFFGGYSVKVNLGEIMSKAVPEDRDMLWEGIQEMLVCILEVDKIRHFPVQETAEEKLRRRMAQLEAARAGIDHKRASGGSSAGPEAKNPEKKSVIRA